MWSISTLFCLSLNYQINFYFPKMLENDLYPALPDLITSVKYQKKRKHSPKRPVNKKTKLGGGEEGAQLPRTRRELSEEDGKESKQRELRSC